jgi:peptide/nickel transport system substrate-binding protein
VGLLLLASCGGDSGGESAASPGGEPQQGGTLRLLDGTEYPTLDPVKSTSTPTTSPVNILYAVFSALVYTDAPSGEVEMGLAESLESDDGGTTWTLTLREGLEFSDGTPFDAAAVEYNWDRITDPANGSPALTRMDDIASYEVVDPLTLTIVLAAPDNQFPRLVAGPLTHIGSPTAIEAAGEDFGSAPVGAGPFVFAEWVRNDHLTLDRNPSYWDAPRPYVDEVVVRWNPDESGQALRSFQADEADLMFVRSNIQVADEAEEGGASVLRIAAASAYGLFMNQSIDGLGDQRVREAFALALDRDVISQTVYGIDTAPKGLFNEDTDFYDPANDYPAQDLAQAQDLIDDYIDETGQEIDLVYTTSAGYAVQQKLAEVIQQQLQELDGVSVEIVPLETAVIIQENNAGRGELGGLSIQGLWPDPALYDQFHTEGVQNNIAYSSDVLDEALDRAHSEASTDDQVAAYQEAAAAILDDMAYVPLRASVYGLVHHPNVQGVQGFSDSGLQVDQVWLSD